MEACTVTRRAEMAINSSCSFAMVLIFRSIIVEERKGML